MAIPADVSEGEYKTPPQDPQKQPAPRALWEERSCEKTVAAETGESKGHG